MVGLGLRVVTEVFQFGALFSSLACIPSNPSPPIRSKVYPPMNKTPQLKTPPLCMRLVLRDKGHGLGLCLWV